MNTPMGLKEWLEDGDVGGQGMLETTVAELARAWIGRGIDRAHQVVAATAGWGRSPITRR